MPEREQVFWPPRVYTGDELRAISQGLVSAYEEGQREIIALLKQGDLTDWGRAFKRQQLARMKAVAEALDDVTRDWADLHLPTLYEHGVSVADGYLMQRQWVDPYLALRRQGIGHFDAVAQINALSGGVAPGGLSVAAHPEQVTPMELGFTRLDVETVSAITENMALTLGQANRYMAQHVGIMQERAAILAKRYGGLKKSMRRQEQIREASLQAMQQAFLQGETTDQARKVFLKELDNRGIDHFIDRAKHSWNMETYTRMVVETVMQEAQRHGMTNRLLALGYDLVQVSDHADECKMCRPWERKVLSMTGANREVAGRPIDTVAKARASGLFHPRCAHTLLPWSNAGAAAPADTGGAGEAIAA